MVSSIIENSRVKSTWFCSLLSFLFDRYCCIRSLFNVNLYGSEQYSWFNLSLRTLFDYDSCLCDIIWCRDQDGGNSTETNLFSCGLSSSFNKDPKQGKGSHGEGRTHRNGYRIAKQHITEQLARKKSILQELDEKIAPLLEEPTKMKSKMKY